MRGTIRSLQVVSAPAAGGIEMYVKELTAEFRRRGHDPIIAFLNRAAQDGRSGDFERTYLSELRAAGVEFFFLGDGLRWNIARAAVQMRRECRARRVHVYHSHLKRALLFGALLGIPRVTTHHNSLPESPLIAFKIYNLLVDRYIGVSKLCVDRLRSFTRREVATIRNGINLVKFQPRVRDTGDTTVTHFISVGRIFPQKNYPLLVEAMAILPSEIRQRIRISIAGEGPPALVEDLRRRIREAALSDTIELLGNRSDIPDLLSNVDALLMTSAWEGLPISLLEATASGLPFIATDVGGCHEVADLCGNGIIVPPNDPEALAFAISDVVRNPSKIRVLSRAAVRNANKLSIEAAAEQHIQLYMELTRNGASA